MIIQLNLPPMRSLFVQSKENTIYLFTMFTNVSPFYLSFFRRLTVEMRIATLTIVLIIFFSLKWKNNSRYVYLPIEPTKRASGHRGVPDENRRRVLPPEKGSTKTKNKKKNKRIINRIYCRTVCRRC